MSRKRWGYGNVYLRGRIWWIYYSDHGRMIQESSKSQDQQVAERLLKKRLAAIASGDKIDRTNVTVGELLDDLLSDYEINGKSLAWAKIVVAHLRPYFGRSKANAIGTKQVDEYIKVRKVLKRANGTINRELAILRSAFYMGMKVEPAKVARVPKIRKLKEAEARQGFLENDELAAIMKNLPEDIADVTLFAHRSGCRFSEILAIRWPQVQVETRMVRLDAGRTKNDESRILPMTGDIYKMLVRRKEARDRDFPNSKWVFSRAGQQIKNFRAAWANACIAATGQADKPEVLFHDLRRTAVRNMVRAGVPEKVAMRISGHKTRSVFERYNIVDERDLTEAARKLEAYLGETK